MAAGRPESIVTVPGDQVLIAGGVIAGVRIVVPRLASVAGCVVDPDGAPIHGAIVACHDPSESIRTVTAADGSFRLDRLAPGARSLSIDGREHPSEMRIGAGPKPPAWPERRDRLEMMLSAGEHRTGVELIGGLGVDAQTVHGRIEPAQPFEDFELGNLYFTFETTFAHGGMMRVEASSFCLRGITDATCVAGIYWSWREPGAGGAWRMVFGPELQVAPGREAVVLPLTAPALDSRVNVQLVASDGSAVSPDLELFVRRLRDDGTLGSGPYESLGRSDGVVTLTGLRPGRYRFEVPRRDLGRDFEITGPGIVDLGELALPSTPQLLGVVTDAAGAPFAGVRIGDSSESRIAWFRRPAVGRSARSGAADRRERCRWLLRDRVARAGRSDRLVRGFLAATAPA